MIIGVFCMELEIISGWLWRGDDIVWGQWLEGDVRCKIWWHVTRVGRYVTARPMLNLNVKFKIQNSYLSGIDLCDNWWNLTASRWCLVLLHVLLCQLFCISRSFSKLYCNLLYTHEWGYIFVIYMQFVSFNTWLMEHGGIIYSLCLKITLKLNREKRFTSC